MGGWQCLNIQKGTIGRKSKINILQITMHAKPSKRWGRRVKYRLDKLGIEKKRMNVLHEDQKIPAPDKNATHWAGGRYWRLPPKQTWHRGFTGRLIHKSATARDLLQSDE